MDEIWKAIIGYIGFYSVSNFGRVKSHARKWCKKDKILKPHITRRGYCTVTLCRYGVVKTKRIHQLVAFAFIGQTPEGHQINHKNLNKQDNSHSNLEHITLKENMAHAFKNRYWKEPDRRGEKHPRAKLTNQNIFEIRKLYADKKYNQPQLARMFLVSKAHIGYIVAIKTWKHI